MLFWLVKMLESEFIQSVVGQVKGKHPDIFNDEIRRDIDKINNELEEKHIRPSVDLFIKKLDEMYKGKE